LSPGVHKKYGGIIVDATLSPEIKGIVGPYTGKTRESSLFSSSAGRGRVKASGKMNHTTAWPKRDISVCRTMVG